MKTILVPLDFSDATAPTLEVAVSLAKDCKSELLLAHVITIPIDYLAYPVINTAGVRQNDVTSALDTLEEHARAIREQGVHVSCVALSGVAFEQITAYARSRAADLIVMGSHGHTALYNLILGSTTGEVLKNADCPVLIVPTKVLNRQEKAATDVAAV